MTPPRPEDYARHFPENGMKLLLQEPLNVRDLLTLAGSPHAGDIDYPRVQADPTTYVQRDYRHVESDLVLRAPLKKGGLSLILYVLIEHQTEPDTLMAFRVLEYVTQILKAQLREWLQTHASPAGFQFQSVLPVVLYTGTRPWPELTPLADLFAGAGRFASLAPTLDPLFVPLRDMPARRLSGSGGYFGQLLRLVQGRREPEAIFRGLLDAVVQELESMPPKERPRWQGLLSYLHALVYYEREPGEHAGLQDRIEQSVRSERHRQEVETMGKTIADMFREEGEKEGMQKGKKEGKKEALLSQLRLRFRNLPAETVALVESCDDESQLQAWIDAFAKARTLAQVGIRPPQ
jgi:hypothetical protein